MIQSLYRGKRKDNGEWHEGHLVQMDGRAFIVSAYTASNDPRDWERADQMDIHPYVDFRHVEVDPDTVGQYIGLDGVGGKFFYGSIGEFPNGDRFKIDREQWASYFVDWIGEPMLEDQARELYRIEVATVIGNKWDHPHLLTPDKEQNTQEKLLTKKS